MLAIRLQRLGRKGYPVYRVAVQEAHRHPSSGRVVSYVGSYNPHTKEAKIEKELAENYVVAQNEAKANFGNPDVYIEKYVEEPRHKKLVRSKTPKSFAVTNQKKKLLKKLKTKKSLFISKGDFIFSKKKSQRLLTYTND